MLPKNSSYDYKNWECNHYHGLPIDVCFSESDPDSNEDEILSSLLTCINDDQVLFEIYNNTECSGDVYQSVKYFTYNDSYASCNYEKNCHYFVVNSYSSNSGGFCIGNYETEDYLITNECYIFENKWSAIYECDGTQITGVFYDSIDCSGKKFDEISMDYSIIYPTSLHTCYQVELKN